MTNKNREQGVIYGSMVKHRRKFLVIEVVLVLFLIWYAFACSEYIINVFEGAVSFDESLYASETRNIAVGEPFELHRNDNVTINDYALRPDSYWQGNKYEFEVEIEDAKRLPVKFANKTTQTGDDHEGDDVSSVLYVAKIGGKDTLVLAYPHTKVEELNVIDGIFVDIPLIIAHEIANNSGFSPDDEISEYMLDTRGLEMESEIFDLTFVAVLLAIVLYLGIKLFLQHKNHLLTPTYRQLAKYGDPEIIEAKIESELKDAVKDKKQLVCQNWIVSEDTFKLKIVKNHMKQGEFKYTPENY